MKLTKAQIAALNILSERNISYLTWGGQLYTSLPKGIRSRETLYVLGRMGLAKWTSKRGTDTNWSITDAGRAALSSTAGREE
jgi:hypothetical protein